MNDYSPKDLVEIMRKDKKVSEDKITFIVPSDKKFVTEVKLSFDEVLTMF